MGNTNRYLIGLDAGTSSIKGVLLSASRDLIREEKIGTELIRPSPGHVEFSVEEHFRKIIRTIKSLTEGINEQGSIEALAISGAGGSTIILDEKNKPLTNGISWMDRRAASDEVKLFEDIDALEFHKVAGWPFLRGFPFANLAWLKEKRPDIFQRMRRFCLDIDYANHGLSGKWSIDYSSATPTYLSDQKKSKWNKEKLNILGIDETFLSDLLPSASLIGNVVSEAANSAGLSSNTKLVAGAFDHPSAAIGTGVFEPGSMLISTGTSWVGFLPLKDRELAVKNKLLVDPFTHKENGNWGAIFSVSKIGAMVDECINNRFSGISSMDEKYLLFNDESQRSPLGSEGLFVDLTKTSMPEEIFKKKHLCRAVMESAAYMLRRKIESFSDCVPSLSKIVMCGGPSQSDTWTQIVSDVTGIPLSIAGGQSSGAIGAAIMAGVGAGVFGDLKTGFSCMKFKTKKIEPDKNAKNKYNEYYRSLVERKLI